MEIQTLFFPPLSFFSSLSWFIFEQRKFVDKSFSRLSSVKSAESIFDLANEVQQGNRPGWRFIPPEYVAQHRRDEINTALEQAELEDAEDIFVSPEEEIIAKMEGISSFLLISFGLVFSLDHTSFVMG